VVVSAAWWWCPLVFFGSGEVLKSVEEHKRRLKGDDLSSTFLHEVIHAILYESGVEHRWDDANFTESVVRALDNGLSRAFDTNSLLVRK